MALQSFAKPAIPAHGLTPTEPERERQDRYVSRAENVAPEPG